MLNWLIGWLWPPTEQTMRPLLGSYVTFLTTDRERINGKVVHVHPQNIVITGPDWQRPFRYHQIKSHSVQTLPPP